MSPRLAFVIAILLGGCGVANFDVEQEIDEQVIPGSALPDVLDQFFELPLMLDIQAQIEAMDTGPIDAVYLSSLALVITDTETPAGDTDDWSFVHTVDVFIESTADGSDLPRVKVAAVTEPGEIGTMAFTPVAGVNLLPYVNEGSQMTAEADADAPPDDVSYDGLAVFEVVPL